MNTALKAPNVEEQTRRIYRSHMEMAFLCRVFCIPWLFGLPVLAQFTYSNHRLNAG